MSDFDFAPGPAAIQKRAQAKEREADALAARADTGEAKLSEDRTSEFERRKTERTSESEKQSKAFTDLEKSTTQRPHVDMPSADLGPPLDPKATSTLAWGIMGMVLIGAAGGRKHWDMAAAGLDGMLKGFKEGSEKQIAESKARFDREFKLAKEKQAEAIQVYEDTLKSKGLTLNQIAAEMKVHAAANSDWDMQHAAQMRDFDKMYSRVAQMRTAADKLDTQAIQLQDRLTARAEKREDRKAAAGGGEGLSERYKTDPDYKKQVDFWAKLIQSGQNLPPRFAQSGAGKKMYGDIVAAVPTLGSGSPQDITANRLNQREMTAEAQKLGTQSASVAIANKELERFIPQAIRAMDGVSRAGWRPINEILQAAENTWSPEQGKLVIANRAVLNAFSQLIQRGAPTVHSLSEAEKLLNTADSKEVYKAKLEQLTQEGEQAELGLKDAHDDLMRRARTPVGDGAATGGGDINSLIDKYAPR